MAIDGMFNNYTQAVTDETALRRQSANTNGMTGWAAITDAMSGIGSEFGYAAGQASGGQTPAQAESARFDEVMASVPDFDPTNPESMRLMSSALYSAGFYNESMELLTQSNIFTRNLAEVAAIEAGTVATLGNLNVAEMKLELEKEFKGSQMDQIDASIASILRGDDRDDILADLKKDFNGAQILQIEQLIKASVNQEDIRTKNFDLSKNINEAQVEEITQQILNLKSDVEVDASQIASAQQNILQSEALIKDMKMSEVAKSWEFAQANGNYEGSFTEYQTLMANLKTVQAEGSINLYDYAKTKAGGEYKGTLEEFVTSITGVDYKQQVAGVIAATADQNTSYYNMTTPIQTKLVGFLEDEIDQGFFSRRGDKVPPTDVEMPALADKIYQIAKNTGKMPEEVWQHYKRDVDYIMELQITKSLKPYKSTTQSSSGGSSDIILDDS